MLKYLFLLVIFAGCTSEAQAPAYPGTRIVMGSDFPDVRVVKYEDNGTTCYIVVSEAGSYKGYDTSISCLRTTAP